LIKRSSLTTSPGVPEKIKFLYFDERILFFESFEFIEFDFKFINLILLDRQYFNNLLELFNEYKKTLSTINPDE
jgi:hypothetical protein